MKAFREGNNLFFHLKSVCEQLRFIKLSHYSRNGNLLGASILFTLTSLIHVCWLYSFTRHLLLPATSLHPMRVHFKHSLISEAASQDCCWCAGKVRCFLNFHSRFLNFKALTSFNYRYFMTKQIYKWMNSVFKPYWYDYICLWVSSGIQSSGRDHTWCKLTHHEYINTMQSDLSLAKKFTIFTALTPINFPHKQYFCFWKSLFSAKSNFYSMKTSFSIKFGWKSSLSKMKIAILVEIDVLPKWKLLCCRKQGF